MSFLHIYPQIGPNIQPVIEQFTYYGRTGHSNNNKQHCKINIYDAQLLLIQNFQQEIRDTIDMAQILDRNYVYIDIKYKNMLKEI